MSEASDKDKAQKERAARIRRQIAELKTGKKGRPAPGRPLSPRDFIDQQMEREKEENRKEK